MCTVYSSRTYPLTQSTVFYEGLRVSSSTPERPPFGSKPRRSPTDSLDPVRERVSGLVTGRDSKNTTWLLYSVDSTSVNRSTRPPDTPETQSVSDRPTSPLTGLGRKCPFLLPRVFTLFGTGPGVSCRHRLDPDPWVGHEERPGVTKSQVNGRTKPVRTGARWGTVSFWFSGRGRVRPIHTSSKKKNKLDSRKVVLNLILLVDPCH